MDEAKIPENPVEETQAQPVLVPRSQRRKPKTRYTLLGLLKSETFWFNLIITVVTTITEMTDSVRAIFGDRATGLLILFAGVVNIYLRTRTTKPTAALIPSGRQDIEAAKVGQ